MAIRKGYYDGYCYLPLYLFCGRHRVEEVAQACLPEHVGDFLEIADRGRHAVAQDAAVEFEGRNQRRLDVAVRVDEAGNHDLAARVDLAAPAVFAQRSDDAVV
jgi:hypothetical protein